MVIFHSVLLTFTRGYVSAARFPGGEHPQQHDRAAGVAALCCGDGPAPFGTAGEEIFFKYLLLWASQPTQNWNIPSQEILGWITMYVLYQILVAEDG